MAARKQPEPPPDGAVEIDTPAEGDDEDNESTLYLSGDDDGSGIPPHLR